MDDIDWVLGVLFFLLTPIGVVIASFVIAAVALSRSGRAVRELSMLAARLQHVEARLRQGGVVQPEAPQQPEPQAAPPIPEPEPEPVPAPAPEPAPTPVPEPMPEPEPAPIPPPPPPPLPQPVTPTNPAWAHWERHLAEHWLVWLGGIALALGGVFLVKLSIDYGLLTPPVRIAAGFILGLALTITGERLFKSEQQRDAAGIKAFAIPPTLVAAGLATVFADLYAAYALYGLIPAGLAFALLAVTSAAAVLMSLRHGQYVAALGLVGAFVVPLLVSSGQPEALALFPYLALITAGALVVLRYKTWLWLAWIALAAPLGWVLLWLAGPFVAGDAGVIAGFLLLMLAMIAIFRRGLDAVPVIAGAIDGPMVRWVVRAGTWGTLLLVPALALADDFGTASLVTAFLAGAAVLAFCRYEPNLDDLLAAAPVPMLAVVALWYPIFPAWPIVSVLDTARIDAATPYISTAIAGALLFGLAGYWVQFRGWHPARWAALSASVPLLVLALAYWRLRQQMDLPWGVIALVLAAAYLAAASVLASRRATDRRFEAALAAYAVAVLAAINLAATMMLRDAWLTVAVALDLPALAWVDGRLRLPVLRKLALLMAVIVLVRLGLNPEVLNYHLAASPVFNWLLYGYGVPALAFLFAAYEFGRRQDDTLVGLLEAGGTAFLVLLVTLDLRHALGHATIDTDLRDFLDDSVETLAWLAMSMALLEIGARHKRMVLTSGGIVLFALATGQAVLWQAFAANPLWSGQDVGHAILADSLMVAYGLPALFYAAIAMRRQGPKQLHPIAAGLALAFGLLWLTEEVRHVFQGPDLTWGDIGEAEWYAYSASWLAYAVLLLALGLYARALWLRRLGLVGIGLVVAKVFLLDIAELGGVWRALSFLGLGATLVGIGYAYRRIAAGEVEK